jgi:hypothetical protein
MNRRVFLKHAGAISTWLGVAVVLQACSDDDNPAAPVAGSGDVAGIISANHGHAVVITSAQLDAGNTVTLGLSGGGHAHSVTLSAQQVSNIANGLQVQAASTIGSGHSHGVTFN